MSATGIWTGDFSGSNSGGLKINIYQEENRVYGTATMHEPSLGSYEYKVSGEIDANSISLKLFPSRSQQQIMLGMLEISGKITEGKIIKGLWNSSIETSGVFELKKFEEVDSDIKDKREKIFISYSHSDTKYLEELLVHLKPLEKKGLIDAWSDSRIETGGLWKKQIQSELQNASVAILLISAKFLASDFIVDNELPPLLKKSSNEGLIVLPLIIGACRFTRDQELSQYQAVNDPKETIASLEEHDRDRYYDKLAQDIERIIKKD